MTQTLRFAASPAPAVWFWSANDAWGTVRQTPTPGAVTVEIEMRHGSHPVRQITLTGAGFLALEPPVRLTAGTTARWQIAGE